MSPQRYQQAKAILLAAVELEKHRQADYIERACQGDEELKREVLSLLAHDTEAGEFLEKPAVMEAGRKPGSRIGIYEIQAPIGSGGMGEVYRARDSRLDRDVAIKFLPAEFAHHPDRVERFEREARAAGSLNHPNVLTVHDCGSDSGIPYLVSELLQGETLRNCLGGRGIRPAIAVGYAIQAARGLSAAHSRGIVHRDLKPENLFVTNPHASNAGNVKILDFGLAKLPEAWTPDSSRPRIPTQPGLVLGTFGYMSPEQVRGEPADQCSDIFSLGAVLFEMLAGRRPFERETWVEEMSAIVRDDPPELPAELPGIGNPVELRRIVRRCLAKPAEERFESARDLAFALESVLEPVVEKTSGFPVKTLLFTAAAVLSIAGAAFVLARSWSRAPATFKRLTFRRGIVSAARFTRDGGTIVYSAQWDADDFKLYLTRPDNPESHLQGHEGAMLFALSSRDELALCQPTARTQHGVLGTLVRVPLNGGAPVEKSSNVAAADWSPDGSELAAVRVDNERWQIEYPLGHVLRRAESAGGYMEAVRFAPGGDAIAFLDHPLLDDSAGWVAMVDTAGHYRQLSGRFNSMRGLAWSPDGNEIWFAAARRGTTLSVWAVDRSGRERVILHLPSYVSLEDIARDGRVLLGLHTLSESMVYVDSAGASKDLYWHDESQVRDISRDGASLLFAESGDATRQDYEVYLRKSDGSDAANLGTGLPLSLSPDARWVIASPAGPDAPLTLLPVGQGEARQLAGSNISHVGAAWLPDGKSLVFAGAAPREGLRYYVQALDGGAARAITGSDIHYERRSPVAVSEDGRVAALGGDYRLRIYPVSGGEGRAVPGLDPGYTPLQWCPDQRLVVHRYEDPEPRLWKLDAATGKPELWKKINPPNPVGLLDITPIRVSGDCGSYAYSPLNVLSQVFLTTGLR